MKRNHAKKLIGSWIFHHFFRFTDPRSVCQVIWSISRVVVSNIFIFHPNLRKMNPFWRIFFRWVETTNQIWITTLNPLPLLHKKPPKKSRWDWWWPYVVCTQEPKGGKRFVGCFIVVSLWSGCMGVFYQQVESTFLIYSLTKRCGYRYCYGLCVFLKKLLCQDARIFFHQQWPFIIVGTYNGRL